MVAEPTTLPGDDGAGLNEDESIPPASPGPGQPRPEQPIGDLGVGPRLAPLIDGELVAQGKEFELEGGPRSEASANGGEDGEEDLLHGGQATQLRRQRVGFVNVAWLYSVELS